LDISSAPVPLPKAFSSGFAPPCIPTRAARPPAGPDCVHEIKHDGYRLIARRDGETVRLFTRRGYDWTGGSLNFDASGRYCRWWQRVAARKLPLGRADIKPEEYKALAQGVVANFGTWSVNETDKTLTGGSIAVQVDCRACGVRVEELPWAIGKHQLAKAYMLFLAHWDRKLSWQETAVASAVARQPSLGVACAVSIDQYTCITEKRYAVLTPNSSIPSTASSAPIICQGRCSVSRDAPRVLIESSEKSKASMGDWQGNRISKERQ
jgi:hypothetical protein